jgi:hypothetical protein
MSWRQGPSCGCSASLRQLSSMRRAGRRRPWDYPRRCTAKFRPDPAGRGVCGRAGVVADGGPGDAAGVAVRHRRLGSCSPIICAESGSLPKGYAVLPLPLWERVGVRGPCRPQRRFSLTRLACARHPLPSRERVGREGRGERCFPERRRLISERRRGFRGPRCSRSASGESPAPRTSDRDACQPDVASRAGRRPPRSPAAPRSRRNPRRKGRSAPACGTCTRRVGDSGDGARARRSVPLVHAVHSTSVRKECAAGDVHAKKKSGADARA